MLACDRSFKFEMDFHVRRFFLNELINLIATIINSTNFHIQALTNSLIPTPPYIQDFSFSASVCIVALSNTFDTIIVDIAYSRMYQ